MTRSNLNRKPSTSSLPKVETLKTNPSPEPRKPSEAEQISAYKVLQARAQRASTRKRDKKRFLELFRAAMPPPGVLPKELADKGAPKMALDWIDQNVSGAFSSNVQNYYMSAYIEGQEFLGYAILVVLAQRAEYRVITETLAADMTREWIRFTEAKNVNADKTEKIAELEDYLNHLNLKGVTYKSILNDGFQGRGQIFIDTGLPVMDAGVNFGASEELKTSIGNGRDAVSKEKLRKGCVKELLAIEPMWVYPNWYNASQPLRPDWYRPETWFVMGSEVHRTRLITFVGRPVADMLKPAYSFGGLSMTQMAKPYVDFWLRDRTSSSDLLNGFSTMVLMTTLDVTTMSQASGDVLWERIQTFNSLRDNLGLMVLNKATEDFKNVSASLGGVHELVAQAQEHISSVAQIPTAKLLGIQPAGLNADSEGIIRLYYDRIKAFQESLLRAPLQTIIDICMISLWGKVDKDITFEFNPLWQLDEAGKGAIQLTRAQIIETDIASGVIDAEEGRKARAADPDSPYAGLDLQEREQMEQTPAPGEELEEQQLEGSEGQSKGPINPSSAGGESNWLNKRITEEAGGFGGAATGGFPTKTGGLDDLGDINGLGPEWIDAARNALGKNVSLGVDWAEDKTNWKEELHPRDPDGKFSKSGTANPKMSEMLKGAGFVKHPEAKSELYHHPSGHSVGFQPFSAAEPNAVTPYFVHYQDKKHQANLGGPKALQAIIDKYGLTPGQAKKAVEAAQKKVELPVPENIFQKKILENFKSGNKDDILYQFKILADNSFLNSATAEFVQKLKDYVDANGWPDGSKAEPAQAEAKKVEGPKPASQTQTQPKPSSNISRPPESSSRYQRHAILFKNAARTSSITTPEAKEICPTLEQEWWNKHSQDVRYAFTYYTGSGYHSINGSLRSWDSADPETVKMVDHMDEAFEDDAAPITKDVIVRRGENIPAEKVKKWAEALKSGVPVRMNKDGFTSASMADKAAFSNKNTIFEIVARKGTRMIGNAPNPGENEVLLRHGQSFEVFEIEEKPDKTYIRMVTN